MIVPPRPFFCREFMAVIFCAIGSCAFSADDCSVLRLTSVFRSGNPPTTYDEFANSVAANESLAVVGARADGRLPAGSLHVYVRDGASWTHQTVKFSTRDADNSLGEVVALDGESILASSGASRVYAFSREGAHWIQRQRIEPSDAPNGGGGYFGYSIAVANDTMVIGAPADNNVTGAVYIFNRLGSNWVESAKLRPSDGRPWDAFGWSVAIDDNRIVVGSGRHAGLLEAGIGYVFRLEEGTWVEEAKLFPENTRLYDDGGITVAIVGKNAAINYSGLQNAVHLFCRTNDVWTRVQKITATNASLERWFGFTLQMKGNRLAIGSPYAALGGRVHLLAHNGTNWAHEQTLESVSGYTEVSFGGVIALYSNGLLVGAHGRGPFAPDNSGTAFLYEFDATPPVIHSVEATPNMLWPPNGKVVPVTIDVDVSDNCGSTTCKISRVWSDKLLDPNDWQITGDLSLNLRAARNSDDSDRTYNVTIECRDTVGHLSSTEIAIIVPHDMRPARR